MRAKTYFVSDCHLAESHPEVVSLFVDFLRHEAREAQALYLLGDIFNVWVGDDCLTPLSHLIQKELTSLHQQGVRLYFIAGNRDFLMGQRYLQATGVKILNDPTIIDLYGRKTWIGHGDQLCTQDRRYQRFRTFVRCSLIKRLFLWLPLGRRKNIARNLRAKSVEHQNIIDRTITDVFPKAIEKAFIKHDVDWMIHGHTHRPQQHLHRVEGRPRTRVVLGDWHVGNAQIACASPDGVELIDVSYAQQRQKHQDFETGSSTGNEMLFDSTVDVGSEDST